MMLGAPMLMPALVVILSECRGLLPGTSLRFVYWLFTSASPPLLIFPKTKRLRVAPFRRLHQSRVDDSVANFILIHFPENGAYDAKAADAFLHSRGIALRALGNYNLPHALRMTIGSEEANRRVVQALAEFMASRA